MTTVREKYLSLTSEMHIIGERGNKRNLTNIFSILKSHIKLGVKFKIKLRIYGSAGAMMSLEGWSWGRGASNTER